MDLIDRIQDAHKKLFPGYLGIEVTKATEDEVVGNLEIKGNLCTLGDIAHGVKIS